MTKLRKPLANAGGFFYTCNMQIILCLGSNLNNPPANLGKAVELIKADLLDNVICSKTYRFPALVPDNAPESWNIDYANMVITGQLKNKDMKPLDFLRAIKAIELNLGRQPSAHWAPRIIDIDILAWGGEVIREPELSIPHLELPNREFVLVPLNDIAPNWVHPVTKKKLSEYISELDLWKYLEY